MWKEKTYNLIAHSGIWTMQKFFPEYFATEPLRPTDRYIEYPWVLKKLAKTPRKILDVGSSGSMLPLLINAFGHNVYCIDIRPLPQTVQEFKRVTFIHRDICRNCLPDNYFDVITAISTIEHIGLNNRYGANNNSSDILAIQEIYRILKPGGDFYMSVPSADEDKITKTHKIYDWQKIKNLIAPFGNNYFMMFDDSPEAGYEIALIEAVK